MISALLRWQAGHVRIDSTPTRIQESEKIGVRLPVSQFGVV